MEDLTRQVINNAYIVKSFLHETSFLQRWSISAIFAPTFFFFDLIKENKDSLSQEDHTTLSKKLQNLQSIKNPYILKTIEFGEYKGQMFSVQQKVSGKTLSDYVDKENTLPESEVLKIINTLINVLYDLEKNNLHHNLLTPQNIIMPKTSTKKGSCYIDNTLLFDQLKMMNVKITSHYSNPDPFIFCINSMENTYLSSAQNDIYSLGAIFYWLITNKIPYNSSSQEELEENQQFKKITLDFIKNNKIKTFLRNVLVDQKYTTIVKLKNDFDSLYMNEMLQEINSIKEPNNLETNEPIEELDTIEEVEFIEELETSEEKVVLNKVKNAKDPSSEVEIPKPKKNKIVTYIKTLFGFLGNRYEKNNSKQKSPSWFRGKKKDSSRTNTYQTPTGNLQNNDNIQQKNRTKKILEALASHYVDLKKPTTNPNQNPQNNHIKANPEKRTKKDSFLLFSTTQDDSRGHDTSNLKTFNHEQSLEKSETKKVNDRLKETKAKTSIFDNQLLNKENSSTTDNLVFQIKEQQLSPSSTPAGTSKNLKEEENIRNREILANQHKKLLEQNKVPNYKQTENSEDTIKMQQEPVIQEIKELDSLMQSKDLNINKSNLTPPKTGMDGIPLETRDSLLSKNNNMFPIKESFDGSKNSLLSGDNNPDPTENFLKESSNSPNNLSPTQEPQEESNDNPKQCENSTQKTTNHSLKVSKRLGLWLRFIKFLKEHLKFIK